MFVVIKTNNASEIIINIPASGAEKSLPAIAGMLENNAVFIHDSWSELKIVSPEMNITLGSTYKVDGRGEKQDLIIKECGAVIGEEFEIATPDVLASNKQVVEAKNKEIKRLRDELDITKRELALTKESLSNAMESIQRLAKGEDDLDQEAAA